MKKATDAIPNQQLVEERLKRRWSQQEVADRVGTTPVNVSRWECGMSSPGTYFRSQLCALYEKRAEELGLAIRVRTKKGEPASLQEPASSVPSLSRLPWNVPYRRNPFFTGREEILMHLHAALSPGKSYTTQHYALSGLGGIGKTQTAIEYAHRYRENYHAVFWARADKWENLLSDSVTIAAMLGLLESDEQEQSRTIEAVKHWLHTHTNWLFILDNAEDLTLCNDILPSFHNGHVLLTTRTQFTGTLARCIDLEKMGQTEGTLFLLRRSKRIGPSDTLAQTANTLCSHAGEIVQSMDGLPLALDQAGAYIEETMCNILDYLNRYHLRRSYLLHLRGDAGANHPESVAVTFSLSIEKVEQAHPVAANLLRLCAFLHPDAIPEEILIAGSAVNGTGLQSLTTDPLAFDAAIKELRKFSLLQRNPETKMFTIHRLVQEVIRDSMHEGLQREWAEHTIHAVHRAFPAGDFVTWQQCQRCFPHVQVCAILLDQWHFVFPEAAHLLWQAGRYIYEQASSYTQATPLLQQSLAIYEQSLEPEHPDVTQIVTCLGRIAHERGEYSAAEALFQRAVALQERTAGAGSPAVAHSLSLLATFYRDQGKYAEAEPLCQHIIRIFQQSPVSNDFELAQGLNTLASVYYAQGKYEQAASFFQQVLAIHEQILQPEHLEIAYSLFNLAEICMAQENYAQAQPLLQRTRAIFEQSLEPGHPLIGLTLNMLGRTCSFQGAYEQAESLFQQALRIRTQALGAEHPCVAESMHDLANLYRHQGKYTEAELFFQQTQAIHSKLQEPEHANIPRPV